MVQDADTGASASRPVEGDLTPWSRRLLAIAFGLVMAWTAFLVVLAVRLYEPGRLLPRHPGFRAAQAAWWAVLMALLAINSWAVVLDSTKRPWWWGSRTIFFALGAAFWMFAMVSHLADWLLA